MRHINRVVGLRPDRSEIRKIQAHRLPQITLIVTRSPFPMRLAGSCAPEYALSPPGLDGTSGQPSMTSN